jgi:hypothetical protein
MARTTSERQIAMQLEKQESEALSQPRSLWLQRRKLRQLATAASGLNATTVYHYGLI